MALSQAELDAIDRLQNFYNGNPYDAATNAGGLAEGGHRENEIDMMQDVALAAEAIADEASGAATSAGNASTSETNAAASAALAEDWAIDSTISGGSAKEWATRAEDSTITGGGGEYSAKHYAAKAEAAKTSAEAAATSLQLPVVNTTGTGAAYEWTDANYVIADGAAIRANFHTGNSASPTLEETTDGNVYEIVAIGNRSLDAGEISSGATYILVFDTAINKWIVQNLALHTLLQDLNADGNRITNLRTYGEQIVVRGTVDAVTDQHVVTLRKARRLHHVDVSTTTGTMDVSLKKNGTGINFGGSPSTTVSVTTTQAEHAVNESPNAYIDFAAGDALEIDRSNISGAENFECYLDWEDLA